MASVCKVGWCAGDCGAVISTPPKQLTIAIQNAEGFRAHSYWDPIGHVFTAGYGQTGHGIGPNTVVTRQQATQWLIDDEDTLIKELNNALPWATSLSAPRFSALVDGAYNLGIAGLLAFHEALAAMQAQDWAGAVHGFDASLWDIQVRNRVNTITYMIYYDVWVENYLDAAQTAAIEAV